MSTAARDPGTVSCFSASLRPCARALYHQAGFIPRQSAETSGSLENCLLAGQLIPRRALPKLPESLRSGNSRSRGPTALNLADHVGQALRGLTTPHHEPPTLEIRNVVDQLRASLFIPSPTQHPVARQPILLDLCLAQTPKATRTPAVVINLQRPPSLQTLIHWTFKTPVLLQLNSTTHTYVARSTVAYLRRTTRSASWPAAPRAAPPGVLVK
jgi:hypothetical protein